MGKGDRRKVAWTLSKAAQRLPAAERQQFREFLNGLPGGGPKPKKVHSWKKGKGRKAKRAKRPNSKVTRQVGFDFDKSPKG